MPEFLEVKCPECQCTLFVRRSTGEVVEVRKPAPDQGEDEDRFDALMRKAQHRGEAAEKKFSQTREEQKTKFSKLDALFQDSKSRVEKSGDHGPVVRDIDLD